MRLGQYVDAVHGRLAPFEHVCLQSPGVDPAFQGRGHGGRLLRHLLARLDAAGTPCYLDTLDEQNVGLYELLAGHVPFAGNEPRQILEAHLRKEPPPLPPEVPAAAQRVVARALRKDPADRFRTPAEMAAACRAALP